MIHLLNTTIIPAGCDGLFSATTISREEAYQMAWDAMAHDGQVISHVGHEATAVLMSAALGMQVSVDRSPWGGNGTALVLQLAGRPPEGRVLSVDEMEAAGYTWRLLRRETSAVSPRRHLRDDGIPTRNDLTLMSAAERAITDAMHQVELVGASEELTTAVVLLGRARNCVANHIEGLQEGRQ